MTLSDDGSVASAFRLTASQGLLTQLVQKKTAAALLRRLPTSQQAEVLSAGGPGAGAFLSYPTEAVTSLEDELWTTAVRQRLHRALVLGRQLLAL